MIRWSVLAAGSVAVMGAAFVTGAAVPAKAARSANPPTEVKAEAARPPIVVGQKTGYFNMAKVMRECKKAKTAVERLNSRKDRMVANVIGLRNMHVELQNLARTATGEKRKDEIADELRMVTRRMEDADREIQKLLNERATIIIVELYDEMRAVTTAVARENGLTALLAYPDAVTQEEAENPQIKELKLKPPALQPFYLDSSADYSAEIIRRLNDKFDAENDN
jgi:Skp family chaperone for outer membrane proteins